MMSSGFKRVIAGSLLAAAGFAGGMQAARADGLQHRIGRGRQQNQRRAFRRLFQNFQEQVGVVPAHGVRVVQDKNAPAPLRFEIRGTLHGAQLSPLPLAGRIPVVIGGGGARLTMPLVARYADWWNCPGYAFHRFDDLRPLAGRARISTQHPVGRAADPADVPAVTAQAERRFGTWGGLITGTVDGVADAFAGLRASGVERFYLQFSDFGTPDTLARFGAEVISARTFRREALAQAEIVA